MPRNHIPAVADHEVDAFGCGDARRGQQAAIGAAAVAIAPFAKQRGARADEAEIAQGVHHRQAHRAGQRHDLRSEAGEIVGVHHIGRDRAQQRRQRALHRPHAPVAPVPARAGPCAVPLAIEGPVRLPVRQAMDGDAVDFLAPHMGAVMQHDGVHPVPRADQPGGEQRDAAFRPADDVRGIERVDDGDPHDPFDAPAAAPRHPGYASNPKRTAPQWCVMCAIAPERAGNPLQRKAVSG